MKKYIDAEGVMRACYDGFIKTGAKAYREIFALLEAAPAEDVQEVQHGHWIDVNGDRRIFECSVCGEISCCNQAYCNECGARMDKEENE